MTHDEIVAAYGEKHGLADCQLDSEGLAAFDLGDGLVLYVESHPADNVLMLQTSVPAKAEPGIELAADLLGANLFYRGPKSPVAAYDAAAGEIVVLLGLDTRTAEVEDFEDCLNALVASAEQWRQAQSGGTADADRAEPAPAGLDLAARV